VTRSIVGPAHTLKPGDLYRADDDVFHEVRAIQMAGDGVGVQRHGAVDEYASEDHVERIRAQDREADARETLERITTGGTR
jgi:hypothetical protein